MTSKKEQELKYAEPDEVDPSPAAKRSESRKSNPDKFNKHQRDMIADAINQSKASAVDKSLVASVIVDLFDLTDEESWQWVALATASHNLQYPGATG